MSNFLEEYTLLEELGQGGYATVYKVRHNKLGYVRAIRVLNAMIAHGESDPTFQKFLAECRLLLRLGNGNHPNIVHVYQPLLRAQRAIVEMDYVDGIDVSKYLKSKDYFVDTDEVINLLQNIGSALAYCHEDIYKFCMDRDEDGLVTNPHDGQTVLLNDDIRQRLIRKYQVIHNDIHSSNIIRRENGSFVLLDFGLAVEGDTVVRSSRRRNGAPEFKAPEKWDDEAHLSVQSDIYSFGVVLFEMLAGRVPFELDKSNGNFTQAEYLLCEAHKNAPIPSIFELRRTAFERTHPGENYEKDYPDWLEELIVKCLSKSAEARFKNGKDLYDFYQEKCEEYKKSLLGDQMRSMAAVIQGQLDEALRSKQKSEIALEEANVQKAAIQQRLNDTMLYLEMQSKEYKAMQEKISQLQSQLDEALSTSHPSQLEAPGTNQDTSGGNSSTVVLPSQDLTLQQKLDDALTYIEIQTKELEELKAQKIALQHQLNEALLPQLDNSSSVSESGEDKEANSQKHWKYMFFVATFLFLIAVAFHLFDNSESTPASPSIISASSDSTLVSTGSNSSSESVDAIKHERDSLQLLLNEAMKNTSVASIKVQAKTDPSVSALKQQVLQLQVENANLKKNANKVNVPSSSNSDKATINSLQQQVNQWKAKAQQKENELKVIRKQLGL
jgi:serine/threonine-protein kinase